MNTSIIVDAARLRLFLRLLRDPEVSAVVFDALIASTLPRADPDMVMACDLVAWLRREEPGDTSGG